MLVLCLFVGSFFLVAREVRILQDLAEFCRAKFFIFFVFSGRLATHNP